MSEASRHIYTLDEWLFLVDFFYYFYHCSRILNNYKFSLRVSIKYPLLIRMPDDSNAEIMGLN